MKAVNRLSVLLLGLLLILPLPAAAAGPVDPSREVSLALSARWEGEAVPNMTFQIYLVSTVDAYGELTPTADFAQFSQLLDIRGENAESWYAAALRLEQYILSEGVLAPTDVAKTDSHGKALFPTKGKTLTQGLYLVMGTHHSQGDYVYSTSAFFVQLPRRENNDWTYTVSAETKPEQTEKRISLKVAKVWEDKWNEDLRPASIWITLYCDGAEYAGISLPKDGRWDYRWENLEANHSWWVEETQVHGYTSSVQRLGDTFVIKNTRTQPSQDTRLPQTGQLWWPVTLLTAVGLLLILTGLLRQRGAENEE